MTGQIKKKELALLSDIVAEKTGLHFSPDRWPDLERGICSAVSDLGQPDCRSCVRWLLANSFSDETIEILAYHLTIGETYFFRDKAAFDFLRNKALPRLIESEKHRGRNLRIWSAGCCTGEEPYTIAIIIKELLRDHTDWNIKILATDINRRFLQKAVEGIYSKWSFRETTDSFQKKYFRPADNGRFQLIPEIRGMVNFSFLNLAENTYPSLINNTNTMDVIFCRNVLMYFSREQAENAVKRLYLSLNENGWLIVSPSEISQTLFSDFLPVNLNNMFFYQKIKRQPPGRLYHPPEDTIYDDTHLQSEYSPEPPPALPIPDTSSEISEPPFNNQTIQAEPDNESLNLKNADTEILDAAELLYRNGLYEETIEKLSGFDMTDPVNVKAMALTARAYANMGRLDEARTWCENAISADKLDSESYYLLSIILLEQNDVPLAEHNLTRAIYADPESALSYFTLGNIAKSAERGKEAARYFANALAILSSYKPEDILPGSEGMTAGRLAEIIELLRNDSILYMNRVS